MRAFVLALMVVFFGVGASAQETPVQYNAFGVPKVVIKEIIPAAPAATKDWQMDCNDSQTLELLHHKMAELQTELNEESIIARRERLLAIKNISNFEPLEIAAFVSKDNYRVANRLIALKINEGKTDADFKLCVSDNPILARKIYLLAYQIPEGLKIELINYLNTIDKNEPYIIYKK